MTDHDPARRRTIAEPGIRLAVRQPAAASAYRKVLPTPYHSGKRAEDTMAGCRIRAAADLAKADAPDGRYMRGRLEHSAKVWSERADVLGRIEASAAERKRAKETPPAAAD